MNSEIRALSRPDGGAAGRPALALLGLGLLLALALGGCAREGGPARAGQDGFAYPRAGAGDGGGPFGEWKPTGQDERYLELLKASLVEDRVYSWNTLASAVIVRALPYSPQVAGAAEARYGDRPTFINEVGRWGRTSAFRPGAPVVLLVGIYSPQLGEKDLTHLKRFRPTLLSADGRELEPLEIKRYGRHATFVTDYFPVFDHWEEVYLLKFPAPARSWQAGDLLFKLHWPGGTQQLSLTARP